MRKAPKGRCEVAVGEHAETNGGQDSAYALSSYFGPLKGVCPRGHPPARHTRVIVGGEQLCQCRRAGGLGRESKRNLQLDRTKSKGDLQ